MTYTKPLSSHGVKRSFRGLKLTRKPQGGKTPPNPEVHNLEFTTVVWRSLRCENTFQKVHPSLRNHYCNSFLTLGEVKISKHTHSQDEGGQANKNVKCPCSGLELKHPRVISFISSCKSAAMVGHDTCAQSLFKNGHTNSFTPHTVLFGKKNPHTYELHQIKTIKGILGGEKMGKSSWSSMKKRYNEESESSHWQNWHQDE